MTVINKSSGILSGIISILFGAALILLSIFAFDTLKNIVFVIIGVLLILINSLFLIETLLEKNLKYLWFNLLFEIMGIILGIIFLNNDNQAVIIIVAIYLILFPILRIIISLNKKERFKNELPLLIVGILLLLFSFALDDILRVVTIIIGAIIVFYGILDIIISIKYMKQIDNNNNQEFQSSKRNDSIDADVKDL